MEDYFNFKLLVIFFINIFLFSNFKIIGKYLNAYDKNDFIRLNKKIFLIGGVIIFINILIIFFFFDKSNLIKNSLIIGSFFIFLLGFIDDKYNLNANLKLIITILILFFILSFDDQLLIKKLEFQFLNFSVSTYPITIYFTILCLALYLNALNMFDGINLQCGIYSIIILIYFFILSNNIIFLVLISALIPFLYYNYQNKIYLGDSGSLLLGFFFSYFFIKFYNSNLIQNVEEIFILMGIPGIDMFRLFCERIYNKKNPFKKDNRHLHHMLIRKFSFSHSILIIQTLFLTSLFLYFYTNFIVSLIFLLSVYFFIMVKIK